MSKAIAQKKIVVPHEKNRVQALKILIKKTEDAIYHCKDVEPGVFQALNKFQEELAQITGYSKEERAGTGNNAKRSPWLNSRADIKAARLAGNCGVPLRWEINPDEVKSPAKTVTADPTEIDIRNQLAQ